MKINPRVLLWVRRLKRNLLALWFAYRHPDTPLVAKILAVLVVGYAFSPIDLIPDFIPVLGLVDEIILLPFAIALAVKMVPAEVMVECRARARGTPGRRCRRTARGPSRGRAGPCRRRAR